MQVQVHGGLALRPMSCHLRQARFPLRMQTRTRTRIQTRTQGRAQTWPHVRTQTRAPTLTREKSGARGPAFHEQINRWITAAAESRQSPRYRVEANDRKRLAQLCSYVTQPALADERVQLNSAGQVEPKLKTPWRDGMTR